MGRRKKGADDSTVKRGLLERIGEFYFTRSIMTFTMDEVARLLRVSKKTLYGFFATKDEMIQQVADIFASRIEAFIQRRLKKIEAKGADAFLPLVSELIGRFGAIIVLLPPSMLADMETSSPSLYARIDRIRDTIVKKNFTRVVDMGKRLGKIRPDVDSGIVSHLYAGMLRQIVSRQGIDPSYAPYDVFVSAVRILFLGILSPKGRDGFDLGARPRLSSGESLWETVRREGETEA